VKTVEIDINTREPARAESSAFLWGNTILKFEAVRKAVITPARNSHTLFCGAKYSVVPKFDILSAISKGSVKLNDKIVKTERKIIGVKKFLFLIVLLRKIKKKSGNRK
jgi:hypothetical protein